MVKTNKEMPHKDYRLEKHIEKLGKRVTLGSLSQIISFEYPLWLILFVYFFLATKDSKDFTKNTQRIGHYSVFLMRKLG